MPMDKILSLVMQAAVAMVSLLAIYLTTSLAMRDLLPDVPPFISRVRSGYAPSWGGLQTPLG